MATEQKALAKLAELTHPLAKPELLLLHRMTATETLSEPFEFDLELLSEDKDLDFKALLGKPMTVKLKLGDKGNTLRHFHGRVARFERRGSLPRSRYYIYRAVLRPWFWFMTMAQDNRVFQNKTVPEIVKAVCEAHGALGSSVVSRLKVGPAAREYCVQYRESDFAFVSRLLEQEGIYYFFEHSASKHELVLCNDASAHTAQRAWPQMRYVAGGEAGSETDLVRGWNQVVQAHSAKATLADFNFETPATKLSSSIASAHTAPSTSLEVYTYPGGFGDKLGGDRYAALRIGEYESRHPRFEARSDVRAIACGSTFAIADLPVKHENGKYLTVRTRLSMQDGVYDSSGNAEGSAFEVHFEAISAEEKFRPAWVTPKALMHGPQTAFVVGPRGNEIHTDKHGRVKVQFHWDRLGKKDDKSSCWVRVSQPWAGKGFGFVQIPRIGDEVVVSFLEGDPDRPLITGRVYNAVNDAPWTLPDHATVSGVKTRSSMRGDAGTANELRFEDEKGEEYIRLQAEKTYYRHVKENAFDNVIGDTTTTIGGNRFESVAKDQKVEVVGDAWQAIGRDAHLDVLADILVKTGEAIELTTGTALTMKLGTEFIAHAGTDVKFKGGTTVAIEAGMTITLKAGPSFISIGPSGVDISGPMVKINSGGSGGSAGKAAPAKPHKPPKIKEWKDPMPPKK